ncbi:MAG: hypothetical protein QM831_10335 [Kofleriaceae bacterium]
MSGGPKRNPDSLNTIGVVVVGICGAVMVYVTITALQAFYMNDTSEVQTMADYGGQDTTAKSHKAAEMDHLAVNDPTHTTIDKAMEAIIANPDKTALLGPDCTQTHTTAIAAPGVLITDDKLVGGCKGGKAPEKPAAPAPATEPAPGTGSGSGAGSGSAATPAAGNGSGAGSNAGGSPDVHQSPTGVAPANAGGGGGAGAGPASGAGQGSAKLAPGGHAH